MEATAVTVEQILDFADDPEDCNACYALDDVCPFHKGQADGVDWFSQHLQRIADDPTILNLLATRTVR